MGRTLDALKTRDDGRGNQLSDTKEPPQVTPEIVTEWSLGDGDVPYIEVGPDRSISGSPQVLGSAPALRVSSIDPATVPALRISSLDSPSTLIVSPPTQATTTATRSAPARQESPRSEPSRPSAVQPPHPQTGQGLARNAPASPSPSSPSSSLSAQMLQPRQVSATLEPMDGLYEIGKIASEVIAYHDPNHPIAQQYASLAAQLLQSEQGKALLLSGIRTGVGTSTVLLNLAVAAATQSNKTVTIIDANRQSPSVASKLGLKPKAFLQDVLTGGVALTDAVIKSPLPKLAVLAVSASHPEIALGVEAFIWLLATLKQKNDLVLVDGPSLDQKSEVSPLVPLFDSLFLVSPKGEPAATSGPLFQLISKLGGRIRGLLHTQQT